jgi:DUF2934 family protein
MKPATEANKHHTSGADAPDHRLEQQIRRRAHELFGERGMVDGHHLDDWLQAEREIKAGRALSTSGKAAA